MAKGSAMGLWRGKKGSTVFYKLTNSNNAQKQGIRERVYEVANPQSNGQATQRMKLLPAQRVAGVIREIVERGWQGIDYGSKSRSQFLKRALSMTSGYPFVMKDDDRVIPGKYQISKGSINKVSLTPENGNFLSDLFSVDGDPASMTAGQIFQSLIDLNANINEGDQVTFVVCTTTGRVGDQPLDYDKAVFNWEYASFYVDPSITETGSTYFGSNSDFLSRVSVNFYLPQSGNATLSIEPKDDEKDQIIAAAIIISRLSDAGSYLRSSSTLTIDETAMEEFFSKRNRTRARESYQTANAATNNTNWPVDGDAEFEGTYVTQVILAGLTGNIAKFNGSPVAVRARESDDTLVAVYYKLDESEGDKPCVVSPEGNVYKYSVEMEPSALRVSQCPQVSDLQLILWE